MSEVRRKGMGEVAKGYVDQEESREHRSSAGVAFHRAFRSFEGPRSPVNGHALGLSTPGRLFVTAEHTRLSMNSLPR